MARFFTIQRLPKNLLDISTHIPYKKAPKEQLPMLSPSSGFKVKKDRIFSLPWPPGQIFQFDEEVAEVFDDMLERSIPFYREVQNIVLELVDRRLPQDGRLYDLGCSTGNTLLEVSKLLEKRFRKAELIGVDQSLPLVLKCRLKLAKYHTCIIHRNMFDIMPNRSDFTVLNYTLQFISPEKRPLLLKRIYEGLRPGGIVFISEKLHNKEGKVDALLTELYHDFKKRNGYSKLEIAQKRKALEEVLIPTTPEEHLNSLRAAGFSQSCTIFRWCNFASFIGIK